MKTKDIIRIGKRAEEFKHMRAQFDKAHSLNISTFAGDVNYILGGTPSEDADMVKIIKEYVVKRCDKEIAYYEKELKELVEG